MAGYCPTNGEGISDNSQKMMAPARYSEYQYSSLGPGDAMSGRLAEKLVAIIDNCEGIKTICDMGCGNGFLAARLAAKGYQVIGIDASASGVELAQKAHTTRNLDFMRCEIGKELSILLKDRTFDLVISSDVIEHLYRPAELIESALALLRPKGYLIVGTPYHGYLKNLALSFLNKWDDHHSVNWDGGHIKFFSVRTLDKLIIANGLSVERHFFFGRVPWLWKNVICVARKV